MLLAAMGWLAEGDATLNIAASGERLAVASLPTSFDFPVSFAAEEDRRAEEDEGGQINLSEDFETAFDRDEMPEEADA